MSDLKIPLTEELTLDGVRSSIVPILSPILDKFYYEDSTLLGDYYEGYYGLKLSAGEILFIEFPLIKDLGFVVGNGQVNLEVYFIKGTYIAYLYVETFKLRFPKKWMQPVKLNNEGQYEIDQNKFVELALPIGITIEDELKINVDGPGESQLAALTIDPFAIGNTGIIVEVSSFLVDISDVKNIEPATDDGRSNAFKGVYVQPTCSPNTVNYYW